MSFVAPFPLPKKEDQFTVYLLKGCPSCEGAMELLQKLKIKGKPVLFKAYSANMLMENLIKANRGGSGRELFFNKMDKYTKGYRYFPMIFIHGKFIGGYDDLRRITTSFK